jgi:hypothetical protein
LDVWATEYGLDVDYLNPLGTRRKLDDVNGPASGLREIAEEHPTKAVRDLAADLYSSVDGQISDALYHGGMTGQAPTVEEKAFRDWAEKSEKLIELIHDPA